MIKVLPEVTISPEEDTWIFRAVFPDGYQAQMRFTDELETNRENDPIYQFMVEASYQRWAHKNSRHLQDPDGRVNDTYLACYHEYMLNCPYYKSS